MRRSSLPLLSSSPLLFFGDADRQLRDPPLPGGSTTEGDSGVPLSPPPFPPFFCFGSCVISSTSFGYTLFLFLSLLHLAALEKGPPSSLRHPWCRPPLPPFPPFPLARDKKKNTQSIQFQAFLSFFPSPPLPRVLATHQRGEHHVLELFAHFLPMTRRHFPFFLPPPSFTRQHR